jgi:hypothetical protein
MSFKLGRPHLHLLATAKIARHMALGRDSLQQPLLHELVDLLLCELHSALWCEHLRLKIDIRHQTWAAIVLDAAAQVADLMHVHLPVDRDSRLDSLTERAETLSLAITTNVERVRGQQSLLTQIRRQQLQLLALFDEGEVHDPQWTPELKFVNKGSRDMIRAFLSKLEASRRGEGRGTLFMDLADLSLREMHRPVYYGIDHAGRLSNTRRFKGLALVGAAIMLAERWPPVRVVERLEHARGIFWESTLQMRSSSLDALPPHYRATLLELFDSLERGNRPAPGGLERGPVELPLWQEERDRLNNLVDDLVVTEIRCLPGLERFLAPLPFLELAADLPDHGFQVILMREDMQNGEGPRCFAIILQGARGTIRTKKLEPDQARLASYIAFFKKNPESTRPQSGSNSGDAISTMPSSESRGFRIGRSHYLKTEHEKALEMLWKSFVKPIIEELSLMVRPPRRHALHNTHSSHASQKQTGRQRPRVWWIPTRDLTFLPFHAAGIYKGPILERACVADYMVCSYAPTLGAIVKARRAWEPLALDRVRAVLGYAPSKGKTMYLPQAEKEVKVVAERCLQSPASVQILNNWSQPINSTQAQAHLESGASIFHLACHGKQESHPLQSYFLLEDGRLTIETLMDLNLPHATLAYLGACETAQGDHYHTDEAVHLAASMLFCGFRSVIATMW